MDDDNKKQALYNAVYISGCISFKLNFRKFPILFPVQTIYLDISC